MNIDTLHYLDTIRATRAPFPCVEEYNCVGTPAVRVKKKLLVRLKEDGETLAVRCQEREIWMRANPGTFFITDHYRNYPTVLVRLSVVTKKELSGLLMEAWRDIAPKKLVKEFDSR